MQICIAPVGTGFHFDGDFVYRIKCGAQKELHFDHVIPLSRGDSNEAENLQLLCRTCNLAKSDRLV